MIDPSDLKFLKQARRQSLEAIQWLDGNDNAGTPEEVDWKAAMRANQANLLATIEQVIARDEDVDVQGT